MQSETSPNRIFRFGVYEADTATGELRKNGARVKLQDQPFRVLLLLLERHGGLLTREEIRQALWTDDTFVDFDHSLNTLINKLRDALGDEASNPRFIETLARRGYRIIAPVEVVGGQRVAPDSPPVTAEPSPARRPPLLTPPEDLPGVSRGLVRVLFALIQAMYLSFYVVSLAKLESIEGAVERTVSHPHWILAVVLVTAAAGIPIRLYLLAGVGFDPKNLNRKFQKLFPFIFLLDELWALAPFLAGHRLGIGTAFAATAALLYLPFSQRTLMLMGYKIVE
jgi:DNA-binding winged helix-turn-helix (wHTH) protein